MEQVTLVQQLLSVLAGVIVGFSLGLIGGGGSILAVPLLLYLVGYQNPHVVIGTTALAVALTAFINLIPHWRAGNVRWKPAIAFAIPGALGAALGAQIGKIFPGKALLFLFALLMIVVAMLMLRRNLSTEKLVREGWAMVAWTVPVSFGVGLLSGFFGIGGGAPLRARADLRHRDAHPERCCHVPVLCGRVRHNDSHHLRLRRTGQPSHRARIRWGRHHWRHCRREPGDSPGVKKEGALTSLRWRDPGGGGVYALCQCDHHPPVRSR